MDLIGPNVHYKELGTSKNRRHLKVRIRTEENIDSSKSLLLLSDRVFPDCITFESDTVKVIEENITFVSISFYPKLCAGHKSHHSLSDHSVIKILKVVLPNTDEETKETVAEVSQKLECNQKSLIDFSESDRMNHNPIELGANEDSLWDTPPIKTKLSEYDPILQFEELRQLRLKSIANCTFLPIDSSSLHQKRNTMIKEIETIEKTIILKPIPKGKGKRKKIDALDSLLLKWRELKSKFQNLFLTWYDLQNEYPHFVPDNRMSVHYLSNFNFKLIPGEKSKFELQIVGEDTDFKNCVPFKAKIMLGRNVNPALDEEHFRIVKTNYCLDLKIIKVKLIENDVIAISLELKSNFKNMSCQNILDYFRVVKI